MRIFKKFEHTGIGRRCLQTLFGIAAAVSLAGAVHAAPASDVDADSHPDSVDNCLIVANDQTDSDGDGLGNACDADYTQDGSVSLLDFGSFMSAFSVGKGRAQDHDGDGQVTILDFGTFLAQFQADQLGVSGLACADPRTVATPGESACDASTYAAREAMRDRIRKSEAIFRGTVVRVDYAMSELGQEGGEIMPATFVTFAVDEVIQGSPGAELTLRFVGGEYPNGDVLLFSDSPLFDVGEQSVVFVRKNEERACPLVDCHKGRLRVAGGRVFTDAGSEIRVEAHRIAHGDPALLAEIRESRIGASVLEFGGQEGEEVAPEQTAASMWGEFATHLRSEVSVVLTPEELAELPRVVDSDRHAPFTIPAATPVVVDLSELQ